MSLLSRVSVENPPRESTGRTPEQAPQSDTLCGSRRRVWIHNRHQVQVLGLEVTPAPGQFAPTTGGIGNHREDTVGFKLGIDGGLRFDGVTVK